MDWLLELTTTTYRSNLMDEIIIRINGRKPVRLVWDEHMQEWAPCLMPEEKR